MDTIREYEYLFYELTQEVKRKTKNRKSFPATKQNLKEQN